MNKYSKKILLSVVFSIAILFMSLLNVNAVTITETVENGEIANNTTVIGITKFESGEIITAGKASEATYNYIDFKLYNYGYYEMPKIYNYLAGSWYEIDSDNNASPVTDTATIESLNKQDIYYVNNVGKFINFEYNPKIKEGEQVLFSTGNGEKDKLINYENGILSIPATLNWISVQVLEAESEYPYIIDEIVKENASDTQYYSTTAWVSTLDGLKAALANDKIYRIDLEADITGIDETLTISNRVYFEGNGHKLQFDELAENTSGLLITADYSSVIDLKVELTAKEGWQENYGVEVYDSSGVDLNGITVANADTGILVNGSNVYLNGTIYLNDNEFGGIGLLKESGVENNSQLTVNNYIYLNNESSKCPTIWVEDNQGSVNIIEMPELVVNREIPTALGKTTQKFYYIDGSVVSKIEVSNLTELKNALAIDGVTEVTLTESFTAEEILEANHTMTINGNGNTITAAGNNHIIQISGTNTVLTINNTKLVTTGEGAAVRVGDKELGTGKTLKAIIGADTEITAKWFGVTVFGENSTVDFYGNINITDGGYGISGNGSASYAGKTTINVKGGSITSENGYALYLPQDGTANIEGGTLTGASVVGIKAGALNITGGTLAATGAFVEYPSASYNGKAPTGDVIAVEVNQKYEGGKTDKNIDIDITGGTLSVTDTNAYIIREINVDSSAIEIEVTGNYSTKQELATGVNAYVAAQN